jgi:proteasome lid subunit RPN8/RPN11
VDVPLRVAFERAAYAEIVAHAKESLEAEICGVLVGTECVDDEGPFVHVEAVVRGSEAQEGSVHVTFTQQTWNAIHATMDREYPKLQIVGWYHSHPGFGVEFSEMDAFIQQNFFPGPTRIGLVTDPLGGEVAICINRDDAVRYVPRLWVDGREQRCFVPDRGGSTSGTSGPTGAAAADTIASLETRVTQLIQTVDDVRRTFYRWVTTLGMLLGLAVIFFIARQVSFMLFGDLPEPPRGISFAPVPVEIDGKPCLLGVSVVKWSLPPELIAIPKPEADEQDTDETGDKPPAKMPSEAKPEGSAK